MMFWRISFLILICFIFLFFIIYLLTVRRNILVITTTFISFYIKIHQVLPLLFFFETLNWLCIHFILLILDSASDQKTYVLNSICQRIYLNSINIFINVQFDCKVRKFPQVFFWIIFQLFEFPLICVSFFAKYTDKFIFSISKVHSNYSCIIIKYCNLSQINYINIFIQTAMLFSI